ncbi:MAG: AAA family ATPase [Kiritimatiellae bacterium]|nr:AAA family ATPase [Kiritimatiellia bacterium]
MKRKIYDKLLHWKKRSAGKYALLLEGARRVGKSYIVKAFAEAEYERHLILDFSEVGRDIKDLFRNKLRNLEEFFMLLQARTGVSLKPGNSLVVFDEVQRFPCQVLPEVWFPRSAASHSPPVECPREGRRHLPSALHGAASARIGVIPELGA